MTSFLGIWTEDYFGRTDQTFDFSNVATTGGYRFCSERGALAERNGHDKESEKSSI